ncbi:MAG TPA: hypothetical protein VFH06_02520 [Candidatus Saccharimonadales bacterium]|nr:hypothetical protein [Candidatus Saccharimonadales bacterium]
MKVTFRAGRVILPAIVLTVGLTACGSGETTYDPSLLNTANAAQVNCQTVDKAKLQATLNFVNTATGKSESDIVKLNEGSTSLEPLKTTLQNKIHECGGGAPAAAPIKGNGAPAPWPCPENMKQAFDPNDHGNFASKGIEDTNSILALAGKDARYLGFIGSQTFGDVANDPNPLLVPDNSCLSQRGQEVFNQLKGGLTAKSTTVDNNGEAPANFYNTGMVNGRPVVDSQPGIGGNRAAVVYTFADGSKLYVMKRCGNLALPAPGNLPMGTTDHQRPPGTTVTPPPPPECTKPGGCKPPEVCPPDKPHGKPPLCKDDPSRGTTNGNGLGRNEDPGSGVYIPPNQMEQPPATSRKNAPPPAATTAAPPPPVKVTQNPNPPTVAPSTQPPNTGVVPTGPGCGNPDFC